MPKPYIVFKSQARIAKTITVSGVVSGKPDTVLVDLPAAAIPNGAVTRPQGTAVVNPISGAFSCDFLLCPAGDYAPATITASNADGSHSVSTLPMTLYVAGTQPVGTPVVLFPPYAAPAFASPAVALGAKVTDVTLVSTAASDQPDVPFTFGQPFKQGDLAPASLLAGRVAGAADLALQINVKATWPDGSVRFAIISGRTALAAGASKTIDLVRVATTPVAANGPSSATVIAAGFDTKAMATIEGVAYTADPAPVLAASAGHETWLAGGLCTEWIVNLPFKDAQGVEHPFLTAQFSVRSYVGTGRARIDVAFEHTKAFIAVAEITYDAAIVQGNVAVYSKPALVHRPAARFKKTVYLGAAPAVHLKHNNTYFIATKVVPNFDLSRTIPETELDKWGVAEGAKFEPMNHGLLYQAMPTQGGRGDIGTLPMFAAGAIITSDPRAVRATLINADIAAGAWGVHQRDVSNGPGKGRPSTIVNFPRAAHIGTDGDRKNAATGQVEAYRNSQYGADTAHQASMGYAPYLLTGDFYYLEELVFWLNFCLHLMNPGYRSGQKGIVDSNQLRGQAWTLRTMGHAAAIAPDDYPDKPAFQYYLDCNLAFYNATFTDNPNANKLGLIDNDLVYDVGVDANGVKIVDNAQAPFQEDHFTTSIGHVAELGFTEAARLASWKAKFPMGRMIGEGFCHIRASMYDLRMKETSASPVYDTFAQVYEGTYRHLPDYLALPCNSQEQLDYLNANRALPSNAYVLGQILGDTTTFQPALAMATDFGRMADRDLAWFTFINSPNLPAYGFGPQHWVLPRTDGLAMEPISPTDPQPDPEPNLPPPDDTKTMALADRVKDSTSTTGTGAFALDGAPPLNFRPFLTAPIQVGDRVPYAAVHRTKNEWENGFGTLTAALVLARTEVTASSNGGQLVPFTSGGVDVALDLTAAFVNTLAGAHNASATSIADPATASLVVIENNVPKLIKLSDAGTTFAQMPAIPLPYVGTDEVQGFRTGFGEGRMTLTGIAAAMLAINGTPAPADTTAPVLTSPTGTATGTTTATGTVSTNEATGNLYCLASTASTATAAAVKAGVAQAVTSSGAKNFALTGLTASTAYYLHFLHRDAAGNDSAVASSASFQTAAPGDTTAPVLSAATAAQTGSTTASGSVSTDEANGTLYRLASINATETAATIKAANLTTTVTATGTQAVTFTGLTASTQYYAHYVHRDAAGNDSAVANSAAFTTAAAPATAVTLTGPTTGMTSAASTSFTIGVTPTNGSVTGTVVVTPSDNGGGGTFNPASISLNDTARTGTFTYTPSATAGARTISTSNNGGLTNPVSITYTSAAPAAATGITLAGPTGGVTGMASSNFTVGVTPAGSAISGTVTVTPASNAGGSFNPVSVNLSSAQPSATFTFTPAGAGAATISVSNSSSLTNPATLTYTASASATAPAQMAAPVATATGDSTASVTLVAPNDGGSPITGYTVTSNPAGGVDANAGTTALTHNITGLTTGQAYTFMATASNTVGTSPASPASNSVTPSVPADPATYPRILSQIGLTESGSGPFTYTGTDAGTFDTQQGAANKSFQAGVDGYLTIKAEQLTGNNILFGLQSSATYVRYPSIGLYVWQSSGKWAGAGSTPTAGAVVAPATGDLVRLRRTGATVYAEVARAEDPANFTIVATWTSVSATYTHFGFNMVSDAKFTLVDSAGLA